MTGIAAPGRYSAVAMALHWSIALLVIGNLAGGQLADLLEHAADPAAKSLRAPILALHKSAGLTILLLTLVRLGWRLANPPPALPAYMTGLERWAAHVVHLGFYLLLLLLPLTGWAMASTARLPAPLAWFGLVQVPALPLPAAWHALFRAGHGWLGWVMAALIALHLGAALKHLIFDRDNILARMLPRR